jgi:hypothetical protein
MLMAGSIATRRMTGEVRPNRSKMGRNRAAGGHYHGRGGGFAAMEAVAMPIHLQVGLESGYSAVNHVRMAPLSG